MTARAYIPSPCVGICTLADNLCVGCCRTTEDIVNWGRWGDTERQRALAQRKWALQESFNTLFNLDDEMRLWAYWEEIVGWHQRPSTAIEAWLQILQEATWQQIPSAHTTGVSDRLSLATLERRKALDAWIKRIQALRATLL